MPDDSSAWLENVLGGGSDDQPDLRDARCPKCGASDFAPISDLYSESMYRLEDAPDQSNLPRAGGLTDAQIVREFAPPRRKSALFITLAAAIPLGAAAYYVYRRFGNIPGQTAAVAGGVITVIVLMTMLRSYSDQYYHARRRWNRLFMCRKCGQRVAG